MVPCFCLPIFDRPISAKYGQYLRPELKDKITNAKLIDTEIAAEFNKKLEKNIMHYDITYNDRKKEGNTNESNGSKN